MRQVSAKANTPQGFKDSGYSATKYSARVSLLPLMGIPLLTTYPWVVFALMYLAGAAAHHALAQQREPVNLSALPSQLNRPGGHATMDQQPGRLEHTARPAREPSAH